jgi:phospholipid/cholesterol/gamma-HCH transport system substrate-binding protein
VTRILSGRLAAKPLVIGVLVVAALLVVLGRCSNLPSMSLLPSPSGVDGRTYELGAEFNDVLNLPIGARVKLNGAAIGRVETISTKNYVARLGLQITEDQHLPVGTTAQIRFSTPLGELYVALTPPSKPGKETLAPGAVIGTGQTGTAPTIEDTFTALSALLNGGSLDQINVLARELGKVLDGNVGPIDSLLRSVDTVVTDLNRRKGSFDQALVSMRSLARQLVKGDAVIAEALEVFPQAIAVVNGQRQQLRELLAGLDELGSVTTRTLQRSGSALIADVRSAATVVDSLARVRKSLRPTLDQLIRLGGVVSKSVRGDYLNADATVILDFISSPLLPSGTRTDDNRATSLAQLLGAGML